MLIGDSEFIVASWKGVVFIFNLQLKIWSAKIDSKENKSQHHTRNRLGTIPL